MISFFLSSGGTACGKISNGIPCKGNVIKLKSINPQSKKDEKNITILGGHCFAACPGVQKTAVLRACVAIRPV